ncbi:hypothetical protein EWM64_g397 [Hericium alpestre]|uniref:Cytochrome P450 n=1 Tax=Hericium alpestre TaxID=135208 RepID=A0A4Z0AA67_9AGAM|nr:hypothetical protein EWM64_g397 [Hericium alpestre]
MRRGSLAFVQNGMAEGTARSSIMRSMLKDNEDNGGGADGQQLAMDVSAGIYAGMTDTTSIALSTTIYALLAHPEVQKRAQEELDAVVGRDRLPAFQDRADLPGMLHNPDIYPDPEAFKPERFLTKEGGLSDDEVLAGFGFGRRVCPGRNFAMSTLYMTVACLLSVFNIRPKKDEHGKDIPVNVTYTDGLSSRPSAFECDFQPRDANAERVLRDIVENDSKAVNL